MKKLLLILILLGFIFPLKMFALTITCPETVYCMEGMHGIDCRWNVFDVPTTGNWGLSPGRQPYKWMWASGGYPQECIYGDKGTAKVHLESTRLIPQWSNKDERCTESREACKFTVKQ